MARPPLHRMLKKDILWLNANNCKAHRVSYISHYNCYLREHPEHREKVGYFDIETTNLRANVGHVLCWCIYDPDRDVVDSSLITQEEILDGKFDKRLMQELIDTMGEYDRLFTYYGTRFDIPFVRTRAVINNLKFPIYGSTMHQDIYYLVRNKFKLTSNKLAVVEKSLLGTENKTPLDYKVWMKARYGDAKALKYIYEHCEEDVKVLKEVHDLVSEFATRPNRSI